MHEVGRNGLRMITIDSEKCRAIDRKRGFESKLALFARILVICMSMQARSNLKDVDFSLLQKKLKGLF